MAGAFSGHLLDSYNSTQSKNIISSGALSFNPNMHGSPVWGGTFNPYAFGTQNSFMSEDVSEATAKKIATLQVKLNQKLGPEYISQRPGPGGASKLTYAEGWKIINLANEVFGFNGWSSRLVSITTDFIDYSEESRRYTVGVTAIVRVTLRDGVHHEDVGYGMLENSKSKGMALDKCKKEAVTDGLKRALRNFGNLLGNCLYDKAYTQEVVKMKVVPPKFNTSELHRRPECDVKPNIISPSDTNHISTSKPSNNVESVDVRIAPQNSKAPPSLPLHVQKELHSTMNSANNTSRANAPLQQQNVPTTPSLIANRDFSDRRPQPDQPPQRRVTFSRTANLNANESLSRPVESTASSSSTSPNPPKLEETLEETFGYSEDDAFFASVDLGDLDRPIEDDGDAGRPVDFDEGLCNTSINSNTISSTIHRTQVGAPPPKTGPATGMLSSLLPQQYQRGPQPGNSTFKLTSRQDQNVPPAKPSIQTSGRTSIGGFHFPPGMNPFERHNQNRPPGQFNQSLKRPAESIPIGYQPGLKRGMGLQQNGNACGANNNDGREILGQLEIGEGGDVKRMKR
ncbi:hypothetical protein APHAL10511_006757 [Amanita phalloides]|nr:hypothetical protein APHAL10511_006757 [Amanita phalloides]